MVLVNYYLVCFTGTKLLSNGFLSCGVMLPPSGQSVDDSWSLKYVSGDLFSCPKDEALAHCISEDCRMGAGIAVMFKKKFGGLEELKKQSESGLHKTFIRSEDVFFWVESLGIVLFSTEQVLMFSKEAH